MEPESCFRLRQTGGVLGKEFGEPLSIPDCTSSAYEKRKILLVKVMVVPAYRISLETPHVLSSCHSKHENRRKKRELAETLRCMFRRKVLLYAQGTLLPLCDIMNILRLPTRQSGE